MHIRNPSALSCVIRLSQVSVNPRILIRLCLTDFPFCQSEMRVPARPPASTITQRGRAPLCQFCDGMPPAGARQCGSSRRRGQSRWAQKSVRLPGRLPRGAHRRGHPRQLGHQCARGGRGRGDRATTAGERARWAAAAGGRAAVAGARWWVLPLHFGGRVPLFIFLLLPALLLPPLPSFLPSSARGYPGPAVSFLLCWLCPLLFPFRRPVRYLDRGVG